ncbi:hypothetical protein [Pseudoduganella armeniaca]|uniref:Uncharacterized protein n=1 Tax=Pseudoduganella armeniaca TaxID=2072590 RepID=A0A2R4CCN3_9BURK|nr:hypothetical protein [Pseudoduganella armeniaca]AVR97355.1 hypothetical protein C9I28_18185 [Pseudoduganella armeniaca]
MQDINDQDAERPRFRPVPWTGLETPADVELWIAEYNLALQEHIRPNETGYGVKFTLAEGGDIYMQTVDNAIVLDVSADADWVAPLIVAVARVEPPKGSLWILPDDKLIQLIMGLSSLIASTTLVVGHNFGRQRLR